MKSFHKRLEELENTNQPEVCCAFFWVRKGHEKEDVELQKLELKEFCKDLPNETYYQVFNYGDPDETYESFMQRIRKERTLEQWWKWQTIRGVPCRDYKDAWKSLKKL